MMSNNLFFMIELGRTLEIHYIRELYLKCTIKIICNNICFTGFPLNNEEISHISLSMAIPKSQ